MVLSRHSTCADEEDVIGAVNGLHSVHQQFAELVVNTHSNKEGTLPEWQHILLKQNELLGSGILTSDKALVLIVLLICDNDILSVRGVLLVRALGHTKRKKERNYFIRAVHCKVGHYRKSRLM